MAYTMKVGISNKHLHLSKEDLEKLFGAGYELTFKKELVQPGQFAAEEQVEVIGPKGGFKMRVLGPVRPETQVEISMTDARTLGIKAPIKMSGDLAGSPGCKIVGPAGEIDIPQGVIVAKRHAHFDPAAAEEAGVTDGQVISIKVGSDERATIFDQVVVRAGDSHKAEVHLDTDEANACGIGPDAVCEIITD